jgi:hypothetical protein
VAQSDKFSLRHRQSAARDFDEAAERTPEGRVNREVAFEWADEEILISMIGA